jgi:dipeptidyl aminopeptidase/acylaminoacyl peptidase
MMNRVVCAASLAAMLVGACGLGSAQLSGASSVAGSGLGVRRPMTFADMQRMKRVGDPQVSPSGRWVMFSVVEVDLEKNAKVSHLWVVPLGGTADSSASLRNDKQTALGSDKQRGGGADGSTVGSSSAVRGDKRIGDDAIAGNAVVGDAADGEGRERQVTFWKEGESGARFSPDGRQVAFVATGGTTGLSQIFVAPWDDAAGALGTPQRLTNVSTEADGPVWSPDSKRILFTSRVYPGCSDKTSWVDEDVCDRTQDEAAAANPVKAQVFDHLLYRHWDHYVGPKRSHVLVVSATDGNAVRDLTPRRNIGDAEVPTFSLGGPLGYEWAPGSEEIAYVTNLDLVPAASTNNDVFTLLLDDAGQRPRKISTSLGSDDAPAYSPDGKYIAFRSQARAGYESDRFRLMLFDRLKGTVKEFTQRLNRPKGADFDGWIDEFVWDPDSSALFFTSGIVGNEAIFRDAISKNNDYADITFVRLTERGEFGDIHVFMEPTLHFTELVATKMTVDSPPEVVILGLAEPNHEMLTIGIPIGSVVPPVPPVQEDFAKEVQLTHLNDGLMARLDLSKMESFWFAGAGDTQVEGFILRPPNFDPARKYPLKFLIHGGPQGAWGDAWSYRWNAELMAASGYVVVMVNPRGSTGYGQAFIDGVNGDWGGKAYVDLMKGLDAAEAKYPFIDKTRECALGASYGGFMADWILTHTNRFACIVTHDGMFNPQSAYGTTEELWFNEWEFRRPAASGVKGRTAAVVDGPGQPWKYAAGPIADDPFRRWSPMLSVQNAKTPTLVIHSQRDYRLDVSEGFQLFTALQRLNVPSKMLYFPDEGHWVLKPQNSKLWYETVGDWCDRWTKTNAYGLGMVQYVAAGPVVQAPVVRGGAVPKQTAKVEAAPKVVVPAPAVKAAPVVPATSAARAVPVAPTVVAPPVVTPPIVAKAPASAPKAAVSSEGDAQAGVNGASFSIAISAVEDEVQVRSDARVSITLKNLSDHQIFFGHRPGRDTPEFSFRIEVRNAAGHVVEETAYGREAMQRQESQSPTVDYLQPGGTVVETAHLTKLVNLSRPGRYTVRVFRKDTESKAVVRSNEITLNVTP